MKNLISLARKVTLSVLIAVVASLPAHAGEKVTYYHNDALGSPVATTNQLGQVLWRETYKPHGQRTTNAVASANNTTWFTGKQEESALGIDYFGARWYHPELGRFLVFDPAGVAPDNIHSFNRYAYANNNPYANVDPDGREAACLYGSGCNINLTPSIVSTVASFIPVIGDALGVQQAIENPTAINIIAAGVGVIPGVGDAVGGGLKAAGKEIQAATKVFSKDKQALVEMAKADKKAGMTSGDMQAYKDLNRQLPDPFPTNKVRGPESHSSGAPSSQEPHGHVGPVNHIPIRN